MSVNNILDGTFPVGTSSSAVEYILLTYVPEVGIGQTVGSWYIKNGNICTLLLPIVNNINVVNSTLSLKVPNIIIPSKSFSLYGLQYLSGGTYTNMVVKFVASSNTLTFYSLDSNFNEGPFNGTISIPNNWYITYPTI